MTAPETVPTVRPAQPNRDDPAEPTANRAAATAPGTGPTEGRARPRRDDTVDHTANRVAMTAPGAGPTVGRARPRRDDEVDAVSVDAVPVDPVPVGTAPAGTAPVSPTAGLSVRRAWPRGDDVVFELAGPDGLLRIGCRRADGRLEIHPPGVDPALPALAEVVRAAGGPRAVVGHRLGRRAVVRGDGWWAKVLRPSRAAAVAARHQQFGDVAVAAGVAVPALLDLDTRRGVVVLGPLAGVTFLDHPDPITAAARVAAALRTLRRCPPPSGLPRHDAAAERSVLATWSADVARHRVLPRRWLAEFDAAAAAADRALAALGPRPRALSHRDLHDAQVLIDGDRVGLLDLDTAAEADPALDLGNLLAHIDFAVALGRIDAAGAASVEDALRGGCEQPGDRAAVAAYRAAARARLAAVHAFRPATGPAALTLLGDPPGAGQRPGRSR